MRIQVTGIMVGSGSTIGIGYGIPEGDETKLVIFGGDARPMIGLALACARAELDGEHIVVDLEDWAILEIRELP